MYTNMYTYLRKPSNTSLIASFFSLDKYTLPYSPLRNRDFKGEGGIFCLDAYLCGFGHKKSHISMTYSFGLVIGLLSSMMLANLIHSSFSLSILSSSANISALFIASSSLISGCSLR